MLFGRIGNNRASVRGDFKLGRLRNRVREEWDGPEVGQPMMLFDYPTAIEVDRRKGVGAL